MFDQVFGLPLHVLVIHAVVVLGPLGALAAIAYAARPVWRHTLRWPVLMLALITGVTCFVAAESGEKLEARLLPTAAARNSPAGRLIHTHTEAGDLMKLVGLGFMVLVVLAVLTVLRPVGASRSVSARGSAGGSAGGSGASSASPVTRVAAAVIVLASVGLLYQVVITGDSGARAAWSSTG